MTEAFLNYLSSRQKDPKIAGANYLALYQASKQSGLETAVTNRGSALIPEATLIAITSLLEKTSAALCKHTENR